MTVVAGDCCCWFVALTFDSSCVCSRSVLEEEEDENDDDIEEDESEDEEPAKVGCVLL